MDDNMFLQLPLYYDYPNTLSYKKKISGVFGGKFLVNGEVIYITRVVYSEPATIVFWSDGTKTVAKCDEKDIYSKEAGLAICCIKKLSSPTETKRLLSDWVPKEEKIKIITLKDLRKALKEEKE